MSSFLNILAMSWAAETAVLVALLIYRALIGMKEDDRLFLTAGEERVEREQHELQARIMNVNKYALWLGILCAVLGVATGGLWGYLQLHQSF